MSIHIYQILILRLFVDRCEMVSAGREIKLVGSQEGHGVLGDLFVSQIPSHNGSVQEGFFSTLFWIILPFM